MGEISAIGSAFCFAACALLFTGASHRIGSFSMSHFRMLFGVIMLAVLQYAVNGSLFPGNITVHNWTYLALSGLTGYFLCDTFLFQCYVDASPRIGSLIF
ncbi:MAG: EamA family transporter, partial [Deltaproteobacteria bacterium]|nr:EamA family transporter [Deltaproteobacteria bacterium]